MRPTTIAWVTAWLDARSTATRWWLVLGIVTVVGLADLLTEADVAFTLAYLLPVAIAAWHLSAAAASVVALTSTAVAMAIDLETEVGPPHPAIQALNLAAQLLVLVFFGLVLARLRNQLDREHELATTDHLTGLANRRAFWDLARHELARCRRFRETFSLAYFDVDGFKLVNDRHGHAAGDELLRTLAQLLRSTVRAVDCVARIGGDEFALLLPATDEPGAHTLLAKLRERLASAPWNTAHRLGISIGCVTVQHGATDVATLMARADSLLYAVKAAGKDGQRHEVLAPAEPGRRDYA